MTATIENMCRTCMLNNINHKESSNKNRVKLKMPQMLSIFTIPQESKGKLNLMELIKTTVPQLKIDENDKLPKSICLPCSEKIQDIYTFQQNCLSNEQKYYKMLGEHDTLNLFNDSEEHEDIFKTEFEDSFIEETTMQSDEEMIMEEEINRAAEAKEEFIESCSDLSIDLVWDNDDDDDDHDWDTKKSASKSKKPNKATNIRNREEFDDEVFESFSYEDDEDVKDDDKDDNYDSDEFSRNISGLNKKSVVVEQLYPCDRCKRKLKSKLSLKKHLEMHAKRDSEDPKFVCNVCDRVFSQGYMLKDHLRTHSGEKPFLCSECGKSFTSSGSLKQHSFRHLNEKLFPCPDCPKSFPTKTDLASHYDVHQARPKSHICDICGRGFPKPFLLKKHKMYHNNDRPFSCEYCDKRFVTNEKLQRHVRIHTGEKPYKCNYCEKAYCQSNELTKHLKIHLGDNVYQCRLCPLRFPTVKIVREHFSKHKNDDEETKARNLAELNAMTLKGIQCR